MIGTQGPGADDWLLCGALLSSILPDSEDDAAAWAHLRCSVIISSSRLRAAPSAGFQRPDL